jgi:hypothetical protein
MNTAAEAWNHENSAHFTQTEGSLPCPQNPDTWPYPEPD